MIGYLTANWFGDAIIEFLGWLNSGMYALVKFVCLLVVGISETRMNDSILGEQFQTRIYMVLAIYMLFKLAFSLLSSIVNPDMLLDKQNGMQKIIPRTIISMVMLIAFPIVFNFAMDSQSTIVRLVPRIILGRAMGEEDENDSVEGMANSISATALSAFLTYNEECGKVDAPEEVPEPSSSSINSVLEDTLKTCKRKTYMFEFSGLLALVCGIILIVILVSYSIDIAIRVLKLGILKILSPIPIISYIDPKSEKNGAFGNWLKELTSTYIELFIKIGILYFVLLVLGQISNDSNSLFVYPDVSWKVMPFIRLALILGSFFFMPKAADFICNILGLQKPTGGSGLLKGLAGIGAAVGIGAAAMSAARTNYKGTLASQAARGLPQKKGAAIASALLGAGAGIATAGRAVAGAKSGKMGAALTAANKRNAAFATAAAGGATFWGKAGASMQRAFTGETSADALEQEIKAIENNSKNIGAIVSRADDKAKTSKDTVGFSQLKDSSGKVTKQVAGNYQQWSAAFNAAKAKGVSQFTFNGTDVTMEEAEKLDFGLLTSNSECYIKNHGFGDKEFQEMIVDYEKANPTKQIDNSTTRSDIKKELESLNVSKTQKSRELQIAKANAGSSK